MLVVVSWLAGAGHEAVLRLVMIVTRDLVKSVRVGRGGLRGRHWPIHGDTTPRLSRQQPNSSHSES